MSGNNGNERDESEPSCGCKTKSMSQKDTKMFKAELTKTSSGYSNYDENKGGS